MNRDDQFDYMLLGRLQMDCEYYIKTSTCNKHLWAGNVTDQIFKMKQLWLQFRQKPEWLSFTEILNYEKQMKVLV